jgi:hypothetical protein
MQQIPTTTLPPPLPTAESCWCTRHALNCSVLEQLRSKYSGPKETSQHWKTKKNGNLLVVQPVTVSIKTWSNSHEHQHVRFFPF